MLNDKGMRLFIHQDGVRIVQCLERNGSLYRVPRKSFLDTLFNREPTPILMWENVGLEVCNHFLELPHYDSDDGNPTNKMIRLTFRSFKDGSVFSPKELDGLGTGELAWKIKSYDELVKNLQSFVHELQASMGDATSNTKAIEVLSRIKPKIDKLNSWIGGLGGK